MATDPVGESRDAGTLLQGEQQVLEMIATGAPLEAELDALCRVIDERSGLMSAVFLLDSGGTRLTLIAGPHLPDAWRRATSSFPLTPTRAGACGTAVSRREQVIVADVIADPTFEPFREAARAAGVGAVWSTPFYAEDHRVLGTFAVVNPAPGSPSDLHLQLVKRATHLASIAVERHAAEEALRRSERLLRVVLDALPVGVAVVDRSGDIILSNPASQRIWGRSIRSGRERYAESNGWWHASGKKLAPEEWASVRAMVNGETSVDEVLDIEAFDGVRKIIQNSAVPIRDTNGSVTGAVVVNEDISARKTAERELSDSYNQMRTLTGRLMRAQDDERRRIAQMLHETTVQDLVALKMLLAQLNRTSDRLGDADRSALAESISLAEQSMTEIRTLSYLLHPPFLDETGLLPALRWYASGFARRSGIKVDLDLPDSFERLSLDTETALFRIVQESLINIHRHAGSETARIRLRRDVETLVLEIEDWGHGIPKESLEHITSGGGAVGVGIASMSERIEQLGGCLEIRSSDHGTTGTTVGVRLPLAAGVR
jgi:two-component system NarL family sensor kinase